MRTHALHGIIFGAILTRTSIDLEWLRVKERCMHARQPDLIVRFAGPGDVELIVARDPF